MPGVDDLGVAGAHLVVGEDQVAAAALHLEGAAEVLARDRGALDVPAGATGAERAGPRRLALALAAPHDAVERVALARAVGVAARARRRARSIVSRS